MTRTDRRARLLGAGAMATLLAALLFWRTLMSVVPDGRGCGGRVFGWGPVPGIRYADRPAGLDAAGEAACRAAATSLWSVGAVFAAVALVLAVLALRSWRRGRGQRRVRRE
ncbi:hypothetical protein [Terracoccus luteus]|uniref:Uncharacterized protein n=2 Tax=Terracoccus luteus TaxID=53356 RepID=A0A839PVT1_9MICO|nr:hypothetical protein [Terracoccus luteus]MBB2987627.1 hypothetical protein [Terracoccus luteus]MCP2173278.1 hypothetical protein [Terracoccus luteus]